MILYYCYRIVSLFHLKANRKSLRAIIVRHDGCEGGLLTGGGELVHADLVRGMEELGVVVVDILYIHRH